MIKSKCVLCDNTEMSSDTRYCTECFKYKWKTTCKCGSLKSKKSIQCKSCFNSSGRNRGSWKGGRFYSSQGYILILKPEHSRARSNGYVLEHIYIMSEHIGRDLLPDENVHHKNGVRDDNRLENLELWSKSQPAGQRAEDLYNYAKELILRYSPLFESED